MNKDIIVANHQNKFKELVNLMSTLRSPKGCPWDREQTHRSLRPYLLEEAHEVLEAIESKKPEQLKDELGDLLFQVIFHAQIAAESNQFDINDVIQGSLDKMKRRHPHVFGDQSCRTSKQVLENWEEIKRQERKGSGKSLLDGVPRSLPALLRAHRVQSKAARVGFKWTKIEEAMSKVNEEIQELEVAILNNQQAAIMEELGDVFFALVNLARYTKKNPEDALHQAVSKFIKRFSKIETISKQEKRALNDYSSKELIALWHTIKHSQTKKLTKPSRPGHDKSLRRRKKRVSQ